MSRGPKQYEVAINGFRDGVDHRWFTVDVNEYVVGAMVGLVRIAFIIDVVTLHRDSEVRALRQEVIASHMLALVAGELKLEN